MKDVKRKEIEDSIPDEFLCPITRELMTDPVIAAGTYTVFILSYLYLIYNLISQFIFCFLSYLIFTLRNLNIGLR